VDRGTDREGEGKTTASERVIPISRLVCQKLTAHKARQVDMTLNVYSHVLPSMQTAALEKIDRLFQQVGEAQKWGAPIRYGG
jgi:hypothetical protein